MRIETLEDRRLMSATVTEGYPGFFEVDGTAGADTINITVSQAAETFTLDGTTYTGVMDISVAGYGGNDSITVASSGEGSIGTSVTGGDGNDTVNVNFPGAIWAGLGDDILYLSDSFRGEVYGEGGADQMYVSGACIDPQINGGAGNDMIDATGNLYGVIIRGGAGDDTIYGSSYNDTIYGDGGVDYLYGNGGNDTFYCRGDGAADHVFGGNGTDILYANSNDVHTGVEYVYIA